MSDLTLPLYTEADITRLLTIAKGPGYRSEFRRDYARLVHSPAFRRLQGKTQLFPGTESDFFRNRLTHSMEVAQIAKSIACKLNSEDPYFSQHNIDTDLVETAGLGHDLGHPPFGHNGEKVLDECMTLFGGFEGNAQTLRIIGSVAKKDESEDASINGPAGLNFTHRTICSLLKYDNQIPDTREGEEQKELKKGYYSSEAELITAAKQSVLRNYVPSAGFKTIECAIMDIADDIAYSTYDLEDALKAGFITPLEILRYAFDEKFVAKIAAKVKKGADIDLTGNDVAGIYIQTFGQVITDNFSGVDLNDPVDVIRRVINSYESSKRVASDGFARTRVTSQLVNGFMSGISAQVNEACPALSTIRIDPAIHAKIEVLKHFTYEALIMSPRLKIVEYRGRDIVKTIFETLTNRNREGFLLLPDDCRDSYEKLPPNAEAEQRRLVCDFIAGMTDKYAIEFYGRLTAIEGGASFFKPL